MQSGEDPKEQAGAKRKRSREPDRGQTELQVKPGGEFARERAGEKCHRPTGDEQTHQPAQRREKERFREQLFEQLRPRATECETHRHFGGAVGRPREEQVGDVGTGDEQHDGGGGKQEDE